MKTIFYKIAAGLLMAAGLLAGCAAFAPTGKETRPAGGLGSAAGPGRQYLPAVGAPLLSAGALGFILSGRRASRYRHNDQRLPGRPAPAEPDLTLVREKQWQEAIERRDMELELRDLELRLSRQALDFRNKELTTYALHMAQKNSMLEELRQCIQELGLTQKESAPKYKRLTRLIDYSFTLDKDWEEFKLYFERVHQDFFGRLKEQYPSLSANELRLCALLKLNLSVKEMASLMGISPESVKMARHRLRKKLGLTSDQNLAEFMLVNTRLPNGNPPAASVCRPAAGAPGPPVLP
jgi:DNA-binding CsgD family transcriptional regulator